MDREIASQSKRFSDFQRLQVVYPRERNGRCTYEMTMIISCYCSDGSLISVIAHTCIYVDLQLLDGKQNPGYLPHHAS